jgi:short-subunit dehydrogenase
MIFNLFMGILLANLKDKTATVTGAIQGIGLQTAGLLADISNK